MVSVSEKLTAPLTHLIAVHLLTAVNTLDFASIVKLAPLYLDFSRHSGGLVQMLEGLHRD